MYCPYEMSARRGKFQSVPFSGGAKSPSVQLPSRSGTRAATEESANLSACRRQPARGGQAGTPPGSAERGARTESSTLTASVRTSRARAGVRAVGHRGRGRVPAGARSAWRRHAPGGWRVRNPGAAPIGVSHGRNRAHSPHRRLALVEPTREFGPFVKAGVRAGGSVERLAAARARRRAAPGAGRVRNPTTVRRRQTVNMDS